MLRTVVIAAVLTTALVSAGEAQLATVGAGVLLSKREPQYVGELHAESPPFHRTRAYITLSWTQDSSKPTVISAAERSVLRLGRANVGIGAGLLWLEFNDYKPYPILVSSTVVQLPIPRTSIVGIASTQPFQDFEWSYVLKLGILVWFVR
jgi:hypothetical protein